MSVAASIVSSAISRRLLAKVVFFALMMVAVSIVITGFITWRTEKREIENRFDEIGNGYIEVIRKALWVDDQENLKVILIGISRLPGIEFVDIHSKDRQICTAGKLASQKYLNRVYPIFHTYNSKRYKLGELHVVGDLNYVYRKTIKTVLMTALAQALLIAVVCALVLFLFYRMVIGRLLAITQYAASLSPESLDTPMPLARETRSPDELNRLANTIERMRKNLHQAFLHQKETEARLKQHHDNLEKVVAKRTSSLNQTNERLQSEINDRKKLEAEREKVILELRQALAEVRTLSGLLPICSICKKIRSDEGYWDQLESYIQKHSDAEFSHGICPECAKRHYPDFNIYNE